MQIDFSQKIYDIETGVPIKHPYKQVTEGPTPGYPQGRIIDPGPDLTLGSACIFPLNHADKDEAGKPLDVPTSLRFHTLAALIQESVNKGKKLVLKSPDIVLLSALMVGAYKPVIAGPCLMMLEGQTPYRPPAPAKEEELKKEEPEEEE